MKKKTEATPAPRPKNATVVSTIPMEERLSILEKTDGLTGSALEAKSLELKVTTQLILYWRRIRRIIVLTLEKQQATRDAQAQHDIDPLPIRVVKPE